MTNDKQLKIHHNTSKRAAKMGVTLQGYVKAGLPQFQASHPDVKMAITANSPQDALDLIFLELKPVASPTPKATPTPSKKASARKTPVPVKDKPAEDAPAPNKSVVKKRYKEAYARNGGNSGSKLSKALSDVYVGGGLPAIVAVARENGIKWIYQQLDAGRQRMVLSTILKGMDRRGEVVMIEGKKISNGRAFYNVDTE